MPETLIRTGDSVNVRIPGIPKDYICEVIEVHDPMSLHVYHEDINSGIRFRVRFVEKGNFCHWVPLDPTHPHAFKAMVTGPDKSSTLSIPEVGTDIQLQYGGNRYEARVMEIYDDDPLAPVLQVRCMGFNGGDKFPAIKDGGGGWVPNAMLRETGPTLTMEQQSNIDKMAAIGKCGAYLAYAAAINDVTPEEVSGIILALANRKLRMIAEGGNDKRATLELLKQDLK